MYGEINLIDDLIGIGHPCPEGCHCIGPCNNCGKCPCSGPQIFACMNCGARPCPWCYSCGC